MIFCETEIRERESNFYKDIIRLYLKYGSVDEVFKVTNYSLPISYPGMHHLISRWGIVKSVGPNSKLSEALTFLTLLTQSKLPLEFLYRNLPPSFKTSMSTMHRIAHNVKEGIVRRHGTALVVTLRDNPHEILIGQDIPHNAHTLPMTYSSNKESSQTSIIRVLQQEVFSDLAVEKFNFTKIVDDKISPFMHLTIADINVSVYQLVLDFEFLKIHSFSSMKVKDHQFIPTADLLQAENNNLRPGVLEIVAGFEKYLGQGIYLSDQISNLNLALLEVQ